MIDDRLRELERRFRETGAPEHEAAVLRERARIGHLSSEKLLLAAYVGHEASRIATDVASDFGAGDLAAFVSGMTRWGREVIVRSLVVLGRLAADRAEKARPIRLQGREAARRYRDLDRALEALERWCRCPCENHRRRAMAAADDDGDFHLIDAEEMNLGIRACAKLVRRAVMPLVGPWEADDERQFRFELGMAGVDDEEARERVRADLIRWALE